MHPTVPTEVVVNVTDSCDAGFTLLPPVDGVGVREGVGVGAGGGVAAVFALTTTVTVYDFVELSSALTVYVAGEVKSCETPESGETVPPLTIMVGTSMVTFVP